MLAAHTARRLSRVPVVFRPFSSIPITQVASVLKLNVANEATACKLDAKMKAMTEMMREHQGCVLSLRSLCLVHGSATAPSFKRRCSRCSFESATRYVCKSEWAYELSFIFGDKDSFDAWGTSTTRDKVHTFYLEALDECGIAEDTVDGGARVHDKW